MKNARRHWVTAAVLLALLAAALFGYLASRPSSSTAAKATAQQERKILYYRNPMNPAIHADRPMKDNMGMDYIPVYADEAQAPAKTQRKILYYRNPMNPAIHSDHPMKDNMGMDYIPVYADETSQTGAGITVSSQAVQTLGVRVAPVRQETLSDTITAPGTVAVDEHRVSTLNPRFSGWLKKLDVRAVGDRVRKGQRVAEIYSPDLLAAENEYLLARRGAERLQSPDLPSLAADGRALIRAARERLRVLGLSAAEIRALEARGKSSPTIPVYAPQSGVVTAITVREGGYVTPDTQFFTLADLARVWVNVDLFADQTAWIKPGDRVTLSLPALPGRQWTGHIDYLYPTLNTQSRTVQARLVFPNPDGILRPGMFANATLRAKAQPNALVIPRAAVMQTASGSTVIVRQPDGRFLPVRIETGLQTAHHVQVLAGLQAGQQVVVSGQFLLDSEASFQSAAGRMEGSNLAPAASAGSGAEAP